MPTPLSITPAEVKPLERHTMPVSTIEMARFLLGKIVVRQTRTDTRLGRIVETEAYLPGDPACHAYRRMTARNRSLFLGPGHAYVYLCYGTSYMLNISSEAAGVGAGVLLRALEPLHGIEAMRSARKTARLEDLTRGPGRLAAALDIDLRHDGIDLLTPGALWIGVDGPSPATIAASTRIGLTKGADSILRFFVPGNRFVSGTRLLNACGPPRAA